MIRKALCILLPASVSLGAHADPQVMQAPVGAAIGTQTIQCPASLDGWPHEVIDIYDCNVPGINVKSVCQKWNNHQITTPNGWDYAGIQRYSGINHVVAIHNVIQINNKPYLSCGYAANHGTPSIITYIIRQPAPSGKDCVKTNNYSFRCTSRSLQRLQQFRR